MVVEPLKTETWHNGHLITDVQHPRLKSTDADHDIKRRVNMSEQKGLDKRSRIKKKVVLKDGNTNVSGSKWRSKVIEESLMSGTDHLIPMCD